VALAPASMFGRELGEGRLVRPFEAQAVTGSYWLTRLKSRDRTEAMQAFEKWLLAQAAVSPD
jgi:LysR family transcriptional regulator of beta-lactamase